MTDIIDFYDKAKFHGKRKGKIKLADLKTGTPIIMSVYEGDEKYAEIWGKIRKNGQRETNIDIFCYKGKNINFNSPQYNIVAQAFQDGIYEIVWENSKMGGKGSKDTVLVEQRDNFRIYIGEPADCVGEGKDTPVLLVDLSEGGFRIMSRTEFHVGSMLKVTVENDEGEEFNFKGKIVWGKTVAPERSVYGCQLSKEQDLSVVDRYLDERQEVLMKEFEDTIKRTK